VNGALDRLDSTAQPLRGRRSLPALTRRLVVGAAVVYCAAVTVLAALWTFAPEIWWPVTMTNVVALFFFAPLPALALLAAVLRSRWLGGWVVAFSLLFAVLFGDRFSPRTVSATDQAQIRVATLNVWYYHPNIDRVIAALRAQQADIVALQELSSSQAEAVVSQLRDEFPYSEVVRGRRLALLSRHPIKASGTLENLRAQWAVLDVGGRDIGLVNVHIHRNRAATRRLPGIDWLPIPRNYDTRAQREQIEQLLLELARPPQPYILVGDFNTSDRDTTYALLDAQLTDVYRAAEHGFGFTYPSQRQLGPVELSFPVVRIDYIWATPELTPHSAKVDCTSGSDHCMVVAEIGLPR
jgi:vancomycin resistance protein VanJ